MRYIKNYLICVLILLAIVFSLCACGKTGLAFESRQKMKEAIQGQWTMDKSDLEHVEKTDSNDIWNVVFSTIYDETEYVMIDIDTENDVITLHYVDSNGCDASTDVVYITSYNYKNGNITLSTEMRYSIEAIENGLVLTNMSNGHECTLHKN